MKQSHDAADIVSKIREALEAADHICRVDNWPLNRLKVQEALSLLPQLSAMLAKEPVLVDALVSIARNTCCEPCAEASLVARAALRAAGISYAS